MTDLIKDRDKSWIEKEMLRIQDVLLGGNLGWDTRDAYIADLAHLTTLYTNARTGSRLGDLLYSLVKKNARGF